MLCGSTVLNKQNQVTVIVIGVYKGTWTIPGSFLELWSVSLARENPLSNSWTLPFGSLVSQCQHRQQHQHRFALAGCQKVKADLSASNLEVLYQLAVAEAENLRQHNQQLSEQLTWKPEDD